MKRLRYTRHPRFAYPEHVINREATMRDAWWESRRLRYFKKGYGEPYRQRADYLYRDGIPF